MNSTFASVIHNCNFNCDSSSSCIQLLEVHEAPHFLDHLCVFKAIGSDNISSILYKEAAFLLAKPLTYIIRER